MADYGNPGPSDDSMYSDMEEGSESKGKMDGEHEEENMPTATLPKEILAGKKFEVGDSVVLKVVAIGENEVSVQYDTEGTKEEHEEPEHKMHGEEGKKEDSEMSGMMY